MALTSPFRSLASVAQHLPFHLSETDKVNTAFQRWRQDNDKEAKYHVDLWTYCFIRRYFLMKFARDLVLNNPADMDEVIEAAYVRVQDHQHTVSGSAHYASWVSVVCKNTFLNYRRRVHQAISIDQEDGPQLQSEELDAPHDVGLVYEGLRKAVERLPEYLREVARLRFVENYSYHEIEQFTDKPLPVIRSYVNKAVRKLRKDPIFLAYSGRV